MSNLMATCALLLASLLVPGTPEKVTDEQYQLNR
jgi:hypothetical protein